MTTTPISKERAFAAIRAAAKDGAIGTLTHVGFGAYVAEPFNVEPLLEELDDQADKPVPAPVRFMFDDNGPFGHDMALFYGENVIYLEVPRPTRSLDVQRALADRHSLVRMIDSLMTAGSEARVGAQATLLEIAVVDADGSSRRVELSDIQTTQGRVTLVLRDAEGES